MRFERRVAIVTGSGRGMGSAIAERLAAEGASVVCCDISDPAEVAAALPGPGAHRAVSLDVADPTAVTDLVTTTATDLGSVDFMINNAGIYVYNSLADTSDEEFRRVVEVNLFGVFHGCRAASKVMKEQGFGRIVNTASQLGRVARADEGVYAASKAAVISLTQAAALELGRFGVTVNCICPGAIKTEMLDGSLADTAQQLGVSAEEFTASYIAEHIPVGRFGSVSDMAAMVAWLCSDDASFTTGSALNLTGGQQVFF